MAKHAVWLSGRGTFGEATEVLERIGQIALSDTSLWRRAKQWGEQFQAVEEAQRQTANAAPARSEIVRGEPSEALNLGVAMDGAKVHVLQEGWKELKVGCTFEIELRATLDKASGEEVELAQAVKNSYVAHLGGPEVFGQLLWSDAHRRHWSQAHDSIVLGDGAPWVWNLAKEHFYDSRQAVDWYHAKEHLSSAGKLLHGEGSVEAKRWCSQHETSLFQGHAEQIASELRAASAQSSAGSESLRREAGYFDENQRRMQYMELREDGYPIGSGMVESGCKRFRARFNAAGMRWSREGLERLLPVRAAIMGHRFDDCWKTAYNPPPK